MGGISNMEQVNQANSLWESSKSNNVSKNYGKTVGKPQLSETGAKYYEQLKNKFKDMDFVLVSRDQKENAKANAAAYANGARTVVLIDEDKIERMATDEKYRNQYEGIISNAKNQMSTMKNQLAGNSNVKGYGIEVKDDGTASLFAVLKDSSKKQAERIAKKSAAKKAEKKAEAKKKEKDAEAKKAEEAREKKAKDRGKLQNESKDESGDIVLRANSIEELLRKIEDYDMAFRSDNIFSQQETFMGQNIDFEA